MKSDSIEDSNTLPNCVARMSIETKFFSVLDVINFERSSCVPGVLCAWCECIWNDESDALPDSDVRDDV